MAENTTNTGNNQEQNTAPAGTNTNEKENSSAAEKTFTQEEVNAMIESRIARERKKIPSDVDLKQFQEWKKNSQTDAERYAEQTKQLENANAKITALENEKLVRKAECKSEFLDFVAYNVAKMEGDFATNLAAYKKTNPQYFGASGFTKVNSAPGISGGNPASATTNEIMNNLIRKGR